MNSDNRELRDEGAPDEPVIAAALEWFVRLRDDAVTADERSSFSLWRDANPAHAAAFAEIEAVWRAADGLPAPMPISNKRHRPGSPVPRRQWPVWSSAIAASLVLALTAPQIWIAATADAATTIGEVRNLTLADGSHVTLDADSAIRVTIGPGVRRITILKGRAWFRVAHEVRPFTVAAGDGQVRDIGTAFEVTRRGEGGTVIVTEGKVELAAAGGPARQLAAGQAARFEGNGQSFAIAAPPVPTAWTHGRMQFVATPLGDLLDDLARYGAGRPVLLGEDMARRRMSGAVNLADPTAARDTLLARAGARAWRLGPWTYVTAR